LVYGGGQLLSLVVLMTTMPGEPYFGILGKVPILCPVFITPPLAALLLIRMVLKRISLACGIGTIVFLVVVSFICLTVAMHV
jgi:hypothetical protein